MIVYTPIKTLAAQKPSWVSDEMKTFHPINNVDIDCGVEIKVVGEIWHIKVTFWRPKSAEVKFELPVSEAIENWGNPLQSRNKISAFFVQEEMQRVPRIASAFLLDKAIKLHVIDRLPDIGLSLDYAKERSAVPQGHDRTPSAAGG